jgi:hypothetical protein
MNCRPGTKNKSGQCLSSRQAKITCLHTKHFTRKQNGPDRQHFLTQKYKLGGYEISLTQAYLRKVYKKIRTRYLQLAVMDTDMEVKFLCIGLHMFLQVSAPLSPENQAIIPFVKPDGQTTLLQDGIKQRTGL